MKRLEKDLDSLNSQIDKLTSDSDNCTKDMNQLKVVLYAKFGSAINLDE